MKTTLVNGVPEVSPEELHQNLQTVRIVDVRRPDEFNGDLAHIEGAELVTLGPQLLEFLEKGDRNQTIVFVCRSGGRSAQATMASLQMGYKTVYNMTGGMLEWNSRELPVKRDSAS